MQEHADIRNTKKLLHSDDNQDPATSPLLLLSPPAKPSKQPSGLLNLPSEIHLLIIKNLAYPDALSLKHSCRTFYLTTDTSVRLKVAWLVDRHVRGLPCPQRDCILKTDRSFCAGSDGEVRRIMERRRQHEECEGVCEVVLGAQCVGTAKGLRRRGGMGEGRGRRRNGESVFNERMKILAIAVVCLSVLINLGVGWRLYMR
ncbi:MAG: hypothetical protein Q9167_005208 [Letrouitia subvulpina]